MVTWWNSHRSLWRRTVGIITIYLCEDVGYRVLHPGDLVFSSGCTHQVYTLSQIWKLRVGAWLYKFYIFYVAFLIHFTWDQIYTIKFTHFQCTIQQALTNVYSHVTITAMETEHFHHPKKFPCALCSQFPLPLPQLLAPTYPVSVAITLPFLF